MNRKVSKYLYAMYVCVGATASDIFGTMIEQKMCVQNHSSVEWKEACLALHFLVLFTSSQWKRESCQFKSFRSNRNHHYSSGQMACGGFRIYSVKENGLRVMHTWLWHTWSQPGWVWYPSMWTKALNLASFLWHATYRDISPSYVLCGEQ